MSKKNLRLLASRLCSSKRDQNLVARTLVRASDGLKSVPLILLLLLALTSCDRGATEQIQAAERFADAVTRNEVPKRDSMVATYKFREHFQNVYVTADFITWVHSFYNMKEKKFIASARADVDRDLKKELAGGLIDDAPIEETGMVRVRIPDDIEGAAYFWMVKQKGAPWRVAMVAKSDMIVNFK